jgi:uncharacterized protein YecT (DUF1311 family)
VKEFKHDFSNGADRALSMYRIIAMLLLVTPIASLAQDGPAFDCGKAETSAEKLVCQDVALSALDQRLAERFATALQVVQGLDSGSAEAEKDLRAYQRGWIKGRDDCWKADDQRGCVEFSYLRREGELVSKWLLEDPSSMVFWACGGNPANEVVTYFFDTELPSVRFERGDQVDAGSLEPTASGSRYAGSFGRSIWIKGDEATYREPDPDGSSYECVLSQQE